MRPPYFDRPVEERDPQPLAGQLVRHRAADDAHFADAVEVEGDELGVIAGPPLVRAACTGSLEMPHDVTVGIEWTNIV